jgi:D-aminopeptidase
LCDNQLEILGTRNFNEDNKVREYVRGRGTMTRQKVHTMKMLTGDGSNDFTVFEEHGLMVNNS